MRKLVAIVVIPMLPLLMAAECGKKPNPKKQESPKPRPTISAMAVTICTDSATHVRRPDFWCEPPVVAGHVWVYPYNTEKWRRYDLPAVGETLRAGWGFPNPPAGLEGSPPPRIPEEGARFVP